MSKKVSLILCTYNEVNYIEDTISLVSKTLKDAEIIIIDDNSNDGTLEKLEIFTDIPKSIIRFTPNAGHHYFIKYNLSIK